MRAWGGAGRRGGRGHGRRDVTGDSQSVALDGDDVKCADQSAAEVCSDVTLVDQSLTRNEIADTECCSSDSLTCYKLTKKYQLEEGKENVDLRTMQSKPGLSSDVRRLGQSAGRIFSCVLVLALLSWPHAVHG